MRRYVACFGQELHQIIGANNNAPKSMFETETYFFERLFLWIS